MMADITIVFLLFSCLFALAGVISTIYDAVQELQKIRHILERWSR